MWSHVAKFGIFSGGCVVGAAAATIARAQERSQAQKAGDYYELSGYYYQALGHAWDHFRKDFCIVYRPLYHCDAKEGRFEAHVLATSHFDRFEKFRRVGYEDLDKTAQSMALPGPFWEDKNWGLAAESSPIEGADAAKAVQNNVLSAVEQAKTPTTSGFGTRSHQERATQKLLQ
eukprot:TRINITY_DN90792_c0_g1_i1.p1 TRINITY_DN90792_c0_g1~~TRINITY_DN90792_c0_g1_i1.p1  ORF type:complete len:174 (+),score=38.92 TRINITY_DN90792_c0_g1_i1:22-543(+)